VGKLDDFLSTVILKLIKTKQPKNLEELVQFVQEQVSASPDDITREVKNLQQNGLITLEVFEAPINRLSDFLSSGKNIWFWVTISLTLLAFVSILFFPESGTPLSYLRYAFGFILAAFLPGYCLTETLFPKRNSMDEIQKFTFSVGLSFAVTALVGLFLSFTPFRLTLTTALLTLGSIVIILALVALKRKCKAEE
jgi:FtsH-binding integral membrane protein